MPESRLPIELCELVIGNLDDEHTLRACSLACRAFLSASRCPLFYLVDLTDRHTAESFLRIICSVPSLTSPCRYIHHLCLREGQRGDENLWINKALPLLAERLLHVTILELDSLLWNQLDNIGRIAILSSFLRVESLEMIFSKFESSEQMNQLIASFPSLVDLSCSQTCWEMDGPLTSALPQGIRTITLDSEHSLFFHRLLSRELHPSVRVLRFIYIYREQTKSVGMLLKTLGSSLEELHMGNLYTALGYKQCDAEGQPYRLIAIFMRPHFFMLSAVFSDDINLAHNTHLCSLHLKIFHRDPTPLTWVITLLSQIISLHMLSMLLAFQVEDVSILNTINWTQMENVFNQQRWSNLQKLTFSWCGLPEIRSAVKAFIRAHLPALESCGILCL